MASRSRFNNGSGCKELVLSGKDVSMLSSSLRRIQENVECIRGILMKGSHEEKGNERSFKSIYVTFKERTKTLQIPVNLSFVSFILRIQKSFKELPENPLITYRIPSSRVYRYALLDEEKFSSGIPEHIKIEEDIEVVSSEEEEKEEEGQFGNGIVKENPYMTVVKNLSPLDSFLRESERVCDLSSSSSTGRRRKRGGGRPTYKKNRRDFVKESNLMKAKMRLENRSTGKKKSGFSSSKTKTNSSNRPPSIYPFL